MSGKLTPRREDCKASPRLIIAEVPDYGYRIGYVITPHGVVSVYTQGRFRGLEPMTSFDVASNGRCYRIDWDRTFTDRYLITLAKRFAAEIALKDQSHG
jgi:hypothetical protein